MFTVNGIDQRLAVIKSQRTLHHRRIGSIDLQRQRRDALNRFYCARHHIGFVYLRQADVHIEHVRARVLLGDGFADDIVDILIAQRFLEALFAGRVNALAYDDGCAAYDDRLGI
ncbi:hypothetical protein SDC9_143003 [bioreactor metagenome]|uniref:Uncharacterized protein n=1 Tax=bioreactor metagenome TaxID=1076179 RepID=A0A645E379_9ZZZZ